MTPISIIILLSILVTWWLSVSRWIQDVWIRKVVALNLYVVLESNLARILLDQIVGKPGLLEEPGDEFALLHYRQAWRRPNGSHLVVAELSILTAPEEVHRVLKEYTTVKRTLDYQYQCVFNIIL